MGRQEDAKAVLPEYLTMIESDLMKVTHYLKDGVKVAIVAKDKELSEKLAEIYIRADELTKDCTNLMQELRQ